MLFDAGIGAAVTVWAPQCESVARSLTMGRTVEQVAKAVLMQIAELESHITHLDCAIRSDPNQLVSVTRHSHVRPLNQPVRDRADGHGSCGKQLRPGPAKTKQFGDHFFNLGAVL